MKRRPVFSGVTTILAAASICSYSPVQAQEKAESPFNAGADLVSSYLWRGTKYGTGPAIQPHVELGIGNFSLGSWGSYCFTTNEAAEADLYVSYGFGFGLELGLTDYYFPGTGYFDATDSTGAHALEINLGYGWGGLSLAANYIINEAGGAGSAGGDIYLEAGYRFGSFGVVIGGGNGWHTIDGEFAVCNIGLSTSREMEVTDTLILPVTGSVILNPDTEQFHVVVGVSF